MRLTPLLLLLSLAACDALGITSGSDSAARTVDLRTDAAPAGAGPGAAAAVEAGRIVVRGVFDVPAGHELYAFAQWSGPDVVVTVRSADVPGAAEVPTGLRRYEAALRVVPARGTYVVHVSHHRQGEPFPPVRPVAVDTVAVP